MTSVILDISFTNKFRFEILSLILYLKKKQRDFLKEKKNLKELFFFSHLTSMLNIIVYIWSNCVNFVIHI